MFNYSDIQQIETFATIIFASNRTLADLTNLQKTVEFTEIIKLFSKTPQYQRRLYSNNQKIYLIFSKYLSETTITGIILGVCVEKYAKKNILFLSNKAILIERQILDMQKIPINICEYINSLVEIQGINEIIANREIIELDGIYESNDFTESILKFEKKINYLQLELANAKFNFSGYGENKSVYLKNCISRLNLATEEMETKISNHIFFLANKIKHNTAIEDLRKFKIEIDDINKNQQSPTIYYIYQTISKYIEVLQYIYSMRCKDVNKLEHSIFSSCKLLFEVIENSRFNIDEILGLQKICRHVAEKLFSPAEYGATVKQPYRNNQTLYEDGKQEGLSNELILLSFRMPTNNIPHRYKFAWNSITPSNDITTLEQRIGILSFLQHFLSDVSLRLLLQSKFKIQKRYISLLDVNHLKKYYDLMANEFTGKNCSTIPLKNRARIQEYDAMLMEHLEFEVNQRKALRKAQSNLF